MACDDGNFQAGDGCSSNCAIEDGYECNGGSFYSPDACKRINLHLKRTNMSIVFQTVVLNYEISPAIQFEYSQDQLNSMLSFEISPSNKEFYPSQININQLRNDRSKFQIYFVYKSNINISFYITIILRISGITLSDQVYISMPTYSRPVAPVFTSNPNSNSVNPIYVNNNIGGNTQGRSSNNDFLS